MSTSIINQKTIDSNLSINEKKLFFALSNFYWLQRNEPLCDRLLCTMEAIS